MRAPSSCFAALLYRNSPVDLASSPGAEKSAPSTHCMCMRENSPKMCLFFRFYHVAILDSADCLTLTTESIDKRTARPPSSPRI